jgi:hypothetical protein
LNRRNGARYGKPDELTNSPSLVTMVEPPMFSYRRKSVTMRGKANVHY